MKTNAICRWALPAALGLLGPLACGGDDDAQADGAAPATGSCFAGEMRSCLCPDGSSGMAVCIASGTAFSACGPCPTTTASTDSPITQMPPAMQEPPPQTPPPAMEPPPQTPPPAMEEPPPAAGTAAMPPMMEEPPPTMPNPDDDLDAVRQACVDHINMYRATLGLPPYKRATPEQEACSDMGAKQDADSGSAHGSAGSCPGLGAQNTCPGYPVRNGDVAASLIGCLDQMWAEGEPPIPRADCIRDYQGCFLPHGHYINMSDERSTTVSCGFYEMSNGRWWMNQDFGR